MTQEFVTLPREVVERAMRALSLALSDVDWRKGSPTQPVIHTAYNATCAALEQPQVEQEPVACIENIGGGIGYNPYHEAARKLPDGVRFDLYTHPQPKREPLTDQAIQDLADEGVFHANVFEIVRRIEEEHGIFKLRAHNIK